ncbi:hypothetical protein [Sphingobacterium sp.]
MEGNCDKYGLTHIAYDESCIPLIDQLRKHHAGEITFEPLDGSR